MSQIDQAVPVEKPVAAGGTAVFIDVDNTLVHGSSLFQFGRGALSRRIISFRELWQFGWKQLQFKRKGENDKHLGSFQDRALGMIAGRDVSDLESIVEPFCAVYVTPNVWPEARELIARHRAAGHDVWIVTATPIQIAAELAKAVGATGALGTVVETKDGVFTGGVVGGVLHGAEKATAVARLAAEHNYDLSESYAYSDSRNDLPMLESVGHPVATNPDKTLARVAESRGWPILRFTVKPVPGKKQPNSDDVPPKK